MKLFLSILSKISKLSLSVQRTVAPPASKLGGGGGKLLFWGENKIICEACKICHVYADIVKFSLILAHLNLGGGEQTGGKEARKHFFGKMTPMFPLWCHH